jgi:hypothetical protein
MSSSSFGWPAETSSVTGLLSRLPQHLRAEDLLRVLEVKFLGSMP